YGLDFFPYPSGAGLSVGHCRNYIPTDVACRYKRMKGFNVLHPMGWDAFGLPAENEAIKQQSHPKKTVPQYIATYKRQMDLIGIGYDWSREVNSSSPDYYRWTQWIFLLLYKHGLAYRSFAPANWCPSCATVLANEEVKEGRCWRCDSYIEKKDLPQWFFKITAYADRLIDDLDTIDWPESIKLMQKNWIGRSEGAEVTFRSEQGDDIVVYTTRPDTLWGATFMVLAPEHPLVEKLTMPEKKSEVEEYRKLAQRESAIERQSTDKEKTGVFIGAYAVNPVNDKKIPIWIADYVMMGYGTGAIMAVPAHDERDFEFARKFGIPIVPVIKHPDAPPDFTPNENDSFGSLTFHPEYGDMYNSGEFTGTPGDVAKKKVTQWLESTGKGKFTVNYKLRDWLISRQRYWGAPIPIIHCENCGEVAVPEDELPVVLPDIENYVPTGTGESPLANIPEWVNVTCPTCGGPAKRETDTMGGFACSSWYFLRYVSPHLDTAAFDKELAAYWLPVDLYVGGAEHAVMHLLYARFWTKVLHDLGYVPFVEPFAKLMNQGMLLASTPHRRMEAGEAIDKEEADEDAESRDLIPLFPEEAEKLPADRIIWKFVKMSKSKRNVVTPDAMAEKFGADSLRTYGLFVAPFEDTVQWNEDGMNGAFRFLNRVWRFFAANIGAYDPQWRRVLSSDAPHPGPLPPGGEGIAGSSADLSAVASAKVEILPESPPLPNPLPPGGEGIAARNLRRKTHQTIRKVTSDIERFHFNTAVSALMELLNAMVDFAAVQRPTFNVQRPTSNGEGTEGTSGSPASGIGHPASGIPSAINHQPSTINHSRPSGEREGPSEPSGPGLQSAVSSLSSSILSEALEMLVLLLAPITPHLADELWEQLGKSGTTFEQAWPTFDPTIAKADTVTIVVQVNGKVRDRLDVPADIESSEIERLALESERVKEFLAGKPPRKVIVVPGKLVSIVV
ncbi:MAG: leucine--tRNA ligase, partial [Armatimonadetes bacterium]|nr:leucine--tRNA ligase [Armatimonadota bacterium]